MNESRAIFGFMGISIGAIALLLAVIHFWAGPFSHKPKVSLEQSVAETAVAIKKATIAALKGSEAPVSVPRYQPPARNVDKIISICTAVLGSLAIIFGVLGYAHKEPRRVTSGAVLLGSIAIAFQFAVLALGVIAFVILVGVVLDKVGLID